MDIVLFSGATTLCVVLAAMSSLIGAELRDRRRTPYRHGIRGASAQAHGPLRYGSGARHASARQRAGLAPEPTHDSTRWVPFTVQSGTSVDDIKRQYRALARRYHPDLGGDARVMARINQLYSELVRQRC